MIKQYANEFKREAVNRLLDVAYTISDVSRNLEITINCA